jgi:hypothetical protein
MDDGSGGRRRAAREKIAATFARPAIGRTWQRELLPDTSHREFARHTSYPLFLPGSASAAFANAARKENRDSCLRTGLVANVMPNTRLLHEGGRSYRTPLSGTLLIDVADGGCVRHVLRRTAMGPCVHRPSDLVGNGHPVGDILSRWIEPRNRGRTYGAAQRQIILGPTFTPRPFERPRSVLTAP